MESSRKIAMLSALMGFSMGSSSYASVSTARNIRVKANGIIPIEDLFPSVKIKRIR